MTIPFLTYPPSSQNQRVNGFEVAGDETPKIYTVHDLLDPSEMDMLIQAAYRQIYHEQQCLTYHRQIALESQLKTFQITVKDFICGLVLSDSFRRLNYEVNNNYRFVEMTIQRVLGRSVYNNRETLAWSVVLATKGLNGFIDSLMNTEEYREQFGDHTVPYQRRRILPQRTQGEFPFARMPRYGSDYRKQLPKPPVPTGLFDKNEKFEFNIFMERADLSRAFSVLMIAVLIIFILLLFSGANQLFFV
ncbi:phycobilisome rod-core linker polypeptide [Spirulina sp. CCNP1310]|uniref:phycobilisome rod-core linker polypeptide n=1 Tax=Spirulina sp. CCNP1310 TaxID=3110249 RepID=UPI002B1EB12B|nr:phycobilisome rod-core linker polypeptide [Spirulina sp. CCNP1310]MEA5418134.1 phycobilisome rod-core linker polypeptide [Spirulina sp. CCNP1310]